MYLIHIGAQNSCDCRWYLFFLSLLLCLSFFPSLYVNPFPFFMSTHPLYLFIFIPLLTSFLFSFILFHSPFIPSIPFHSLLIPSIPFLSLLFSPSASEQGPKEKNFNRRCLRPSLPSASQLWAHLTKSRGIVGSGEWAMQYNTIQNNTIQYNTIQYNTIQYNTIQERYLSPSHCIHP